MIRGFAASRWRDSLAIMWRGTGRIDAHFQELTERMTELSKRCDDTEGRLSDALRKVSECEDAARSAHTQSERLQDAVAQLDQAAAQAGAALLRMEWLISANAEEARKVGTALLERINAIRGSARASQG